MSRVKEDWMKERPRRRRRGGLAALIAAGLAVVAGAMLPTQASAGTYWVHACDDASNGGHAWSSWQPYSTNPNYLNLTSYCPTASAPGQVDWTGGLRGYVNLDRGTMPVWTAAGFRFDAPSGTRLDGMYLNYKMYRYDDNYATQLAIDGVKIAGCAANADATLGCPWATPYGNAPSWQPLWGNTNVRIEV